MATKFDVNFIMDYEGGEVSDHALLHGFADGIKTGMVWGLQGFYGRTAQSLIDGGWITREGEVTQAGLDLLDGFDDE